MKRENIVDAGARALAEGGFSAVDLTAIAETVGLKPPSIRYYFKNREDLAEEVYHRRMGELEALLLSAERETSLRGAIHRLFDGELKRLARYRTGDEDRPVQLGEIRSLKRERRRRLGSRFGAMIDRAKTMLADRGVCVSPDLASVPAYLLFENLFWLPAWIGQYRTWEFERAAIDLTDLICAGPLSSETPAEWAVIKEAPAEKTGETVDQASFLTTATRLICDRGYRGASIDTIAAELGVTKGSFYHHNRIKESLVEQCFADSYARIGAFQQRSYDLSDDPARRVAIVQASIVHAQLQLTAPIIRASALPTLPSSIRMNVIDGAKPIVRWLAGELAMANAIARAPSPRDPYIAAQCLSIGANAAYDLARFRPSNAPPPSLDGYMRLLLFGITNRVWN